MGTTYYWRVRSKNNTGASAWSETRSLTTQGMTGVSNDKGGGTNDKGLRVSPNPASGDVRIQFTLTKPERVTLKLYNVLGCEIASFFVAELDASEHSWSFAISDWSLVNGTYFLRLQTPTSSHTQPLQVLR